MVRALIVFSSLALAHAYQDDVVIPAHEELIGEKDAAAAPSDREDIVSRDGRRVAWRAKRGNKQVVLVNGQQQGPEFDEVRGLRFSPDGRHFAHAGKRDKKWVMVVDRLEWTPAYDDVGPAVFSEDGEHLAFPARRGRDWIVVVDGKDGPSFHIIGGLVFDRRSNQFAYSGVRLSGSARKPKAEGRVVMGLEEGPPFEGKRRVFFRPVEKDERGYFDRLIPGTVGVSVPVTSPEGGHVAYVARRGEHDIVVMLDGEPGPAFEDILVGPVFSRNGEHFAYVARENNMVRLVLDGVPAGDPLPSGVSHSLTVSPDGRHVAYVEAETRGSDALFSLLTLNDFHRERVILDGKLIKEYRQLGAVRYPYKWGPSNLMFSPDSHHLAYTFHDGRGAFVVVDGREGKRHDQVMDGSLSFGEDNAVTYVARTGRKFFRVTAR